MGQAAHGAAREGAARGIRRNGHRMTTDWFTE